MSESVGREVAVLNVESGVWERPTSSRTVVPSYSHSAVVVGRTKLLVFGGMRADGVAAADVALLNADTMKWLTPQIKVRPGRRDSTGTAHGLRLWSAGH